MNIFSSHLLFTLRMVAKTPVTSALSILVLAVGIAQVSMMFNMVESTMMRDLPYDDSDRLVVPFKGKVEDPRYRDSWHFDDFDALQADDSVFEEKVGIFFEEAALFANNQRDTVAGVYITTNFTRMLGVQPQLGREFSEEDGPDNDLVCLISHDVWQKMFAKDANVIGKTIRVDGIIRTIVGVMPEKFDFPFSHRIWMPLHRNTLKNYTGWGDWAFVIAKLKPGVSTDFAAERMTELVKVLQEKYPDRNRGVNLAIVQTFKSMMIPDEIEWVFYAMLGCSILVLYMACTIVSNLITARCVRRSQEFAIRSAIGGSRWQIISQMLFEASVLTVVALALGWYLTGLFYDLVLAGYMLEFDIPYWMEPRFTLLHYLFLTAIMIAVVLASSLIPAMNATSGDINVILKDNTRTGSSMHLNKFSRFLVITQVASAVAVLAGCGILIYAMHRHKTANRFFPADHFLTAVFSHDAKTYPGHEEKVTSQKRLLEELSRHPEVRTMAISNEYVSSHFTQPIILEGVNYPTPDDYPICYKRIVSPGYFASMGIPILNGREFSWLDDETQKPRSALVTENFARQYWPGENPVGKRFREFYVAGADGRDVMTTVVGVVPDLFQSEYTRDKHKGYFVSSSQETWFDMNIILSGPQEPRQLEKVLNAAIASFNDTMDLKYIRTAREALDANFIFQEFIIVIFINFTIGALVMAAAGMYGMVSFSVHQKIREIGIRLALGATPLRLIGQTYANQMINVLAGLVIGGILAYFLRQVFLGIINPLFEHWITSASVLFTMLFLATASILPPAIYGANKEPSEALRTE